VPDDILALLRSAFPEALGALIAASVLALIGWSWRRIRRQRQESSKAHPPVELVKITRGKLNTLHEMSRDCPVCLVGGVYWDITVGPIGTTKLEENEWSNADAVEYDIGGSALWVGRFLWKKQQKSYLFSAIGNGDDPHTVRFLELFENERWPLNRLAFGRPGDKTAITVHLLIQSRRRFRTMITYSGALSGFGWNSIAQQLNEKLTYGGVLYISGYFKTCLWQSLVGSLAALPRNTLVCIDHGRLVRKLEQGAAVRAIRDAFKARLVDLYFCTHNEIFDLFEVSRIRRLWLSWGRVQRILQELASRGELPLITLVRGGDISGKTKAYAIVGKSVYTLEGSIGPIYNHKTVSPTNEFNASMMYHLIHDPRFQELEEQVIEAGNKALEEMGLSTQSKDELEEKNSGNH